MTIKLKDVSVQSHVPGDSEPQAEECQRCQWGPVAGPRKTREAVVHRAGVAALHSPDAVDGKQTQCGGAAQTAGRVSQLPHAIPARHSEESDWHDLQVTHCVGESISCLSAHICPSVIFVMFLYIKSLMLHNSAES